MTWAHYLLQANIYLVVFYAFYKLLLEQETYFKLNRIYLLASGLFALCIPFIQLDWLTQQPVSQQLSVTVGQLDMMVLPDKDAASGSIPLGDVVALLYTAGLLFFFIRFCIQLWVLTTRLYGAKTQEQAVQRGVAYSFLTRKAVDTGLAGQEIINHHENIHLKQLHSLDVLLIELIAIVNWFNPVVYLYKKALKDNHEFLADEAAANYQGDKETYSLLLLSAAFKVSPQTLANSFFSKQSLIKKRIYMLHKEKSRKTAVLKYGLYLPLFSGMLLLSSASLRENQTLNEAVETIPFSNPIEVVQSNLPGSGAASGQTAATGTNEAATLISQDWAPFYRFLSRNIKYPEAARKEQLQGNTQLKFTIEGGEVKGLDALTKLGAGLDAEVMKAILSYSGFKDVSDGNYVLGVAFRLEGANTSIKNDALKPVDGFTNLQQVTILGFSHPNASANKRAEVMDFASVDTPPSFPGGYEKFANFIGTSIKYPEEAVKNKVQGKVFLSFVVEKDGTISDIQLAGRMLGSGTDEEAMRVLKSSPKWNPGVVDGKPVAVKYHIPIDFSLSKNNEASPATKDANQADIKGSVNSVIVIGKNASVETSLKGLNTKNGKEPTYIIDGLTATKQDLEKIKPGDIESIHVNKANLNADGKSESGGTIHITTKKPGN
jgi:TonB family protein